MELRTCPECQQHDNIIGPMTLGVVQDFSNISSSRIIINNTEDPMLSTCQAELHDITPMSAIVPSGIRFS